MVRQQGGNDWGGSSGGSFYLLPRSVSNANVSSRDAGTDEDEFIHCAVIVQLNINLCLVAREWSTLYLQQPYI